MATSSLKKSFVITSKPETSKLVKMITDYLSKPIITKPVTVSNPSPELLKEIMECKILLKKYTLFLMQQLIYPYFSKSIENSQNDCQGIYKSL